MQINNVEENVVFLFTKLKRSKSPRSDGGIGHLLMSPGSEGVLVMCPCHLGVRGDLDTCQCHLGVKGLSWASVQGSERGPGQLSMSPGVRGSLTPVSVTWE